MGQVRMLLAVQWEGAHLGGVDALKTFNESYADVPLTHFVSAAYFARGGNLQAIAEAMLPAFKANDEIALYLPPWASVHGVAGKLSIPNQVKSPSTVEVSYPGITTQTDGGDARWLSGFDSHSVEAYLVTSRLLLGPLVSLLQAQLGLAENQTLRGVQAGGWAAGDNALAAIAQVGFDWDASAANAEHCAAAAGNSALLLPGTSAKTFKGLLSNLAKLWGGTVQSKSPWLVNKDNVKATGGHGVNWTTEPYYLSTGGRRVLEIPNLGMTLPLMSPKRLRAVLDDRLAAPGSQTATLSQAVLQEDADSLLKYWDELICHTRSSHSATFMTHSDAARDIETQQQAEAA